MRARLVTALIVAPAALGVGVPGARADVLGGFDFDRAEVSVTGLQVRARDAAGNVSPVSNTVTVTTTSGGAAGECTVTPTTEAEWSTGYVVQVTVTNTGTTTINGWRVAVTLPPGHEVVGSWNAGPGAIFENAPYNGTIAPGQSTGFGFQVRKPENSGGTPTGYACTVR
jgi:hypothetical protein